MTVFWSDPTTISLALPTGDELEEEHYFQEPRNRGGDFSVLGITGPGVAEIKPHNKNGIEGAIKQLGSAGRQVADPLARRSPVPTNWRSILERKPTGPRQDHRHLPSHGLDPPESGARPRTR